MCLCLSNSLSLPVCLFLAQAFFRYLSRVSWATRLYSSIYIFSYPCASFWESFFLFWLTFSFLCICLSVSTSFSLYLSRSHTLSTIYLSIFLSFSYFPLSHSISPSLCLSPTVFFSHLLLLPPPLVSLCYGLIILHSLVDLPL